MQRPKSIKKKTVKFPEELVEAIEWLCSLSPIPKNFSEWVKDAAEFRLYIALGMRIGCYELMGFFPEIKEKTRRTKSDKVGPKSLEAA